MDIQPGDVLEMKKEHPCGEKRWLVLRTGMDFRLRCWQVICARAWQTISVRGTTR